MLINLSNHPLSQWSELQISEAKRLYGDIVDWQFPAINPEWGHQEVEQLADEYCNKILLEREKYKEKITVHLMGELTFCFCLIQMLKKHNITCVASTTQRNVIEQEAGKKTLLFNFVRFREYV